MFTGIISAVGAIASVEPLGADNSSGVSLWIEADGFDFSGLKLGDSIAINGACMTAVELAAPGFRVEVSQESLSKTSGLHQPGPVNLERSLKLGDSLDGHLVSGHVDGIGEVVTFEAAGESRLLVVRASADLAIYLAYKGSIAVNGVSLTVNSVLDHENGCDVSINLIAHTLMHTTFCSLKVGDRVNLEVDPLARYVARALQLTTLAAPVATSLEHLAV
jgi:riboflavin synthase